MSSIKYRCGTCTRNFNRKTYYEKHILACEHMGKGKFIQEAEAQEDADIPSQKQLYQMVLSLAEKCEKMEHEMATLRKYVEKTKKKINILEWLRDNSDETVNYNDWVESFEVTDSQLNNMFKYGYIDGVYLIIQQNLPISSIQSHPIKCFNQKSNQFFMYQDNEWILMDQLLVTKMIRQMNRKIMIKFLSWKEEHNDRIQTDDRFHETYIGYQRIVLGGNRSKEQSYRMITSKLYNYLKCDLKNIIQYEFVF